jgi:hypothetical protein
LHGASTQISGIQLANATSPAPALHMVYGDDKSSLRCLLTPAKNQHLSLNQVSNWLPRRFKLTRGVLLTALLEDF